MSLPSPTAPATDASGADGVLPLAHTGLIRAAGADAAAFLHGQLSSDVKGLPAGACRHTSFNSPKGRMLANFPLWRAPGAPDSFRALLPDDIAEPVAKRLSMYVVRSKVTVGDVSAQCCRLGVGGPKGAEAVAHALGTAGAAVRDTQNHTSPLRTRERSTNALKDRSGCYGSVSHDIFIFTIRKILILGFEKP